MMHFWQQKKSMHMYLVLINLQYRLMHYNIVKINVKYFCIDKKPSYPFISILNRVNRYQSYLVCFRHLQYFSTLIFILPFSSLVRNQFYYLSHAQNVNPAQVSFLNFHFTVKIFKLVTINLSSKKLRLDNFLTQLIAFSK